MILRLTRLIDFGMAGIIEQTVPSRSAQPVAFLDRYTLVRGDLGTIGPMPASIQCPSRHATSPLEASWCRLCFRRLGSMRLTATSIVVLGWWIVAKRTRGDSTHAPMVWRAIPLFVGFGLGGLFASDVGFHVGISVILAMTVAMGMLLYSDIASADADR